MEFHDDYPEYEIMAHHSEADGKVKRRKLWNVFWIMLAITIVELYIGMNAANWGLAHSLTLKFIFIGLTVVKAFYIVYKFMHLGDELPAMKWTIIAPYTLFILYLVWVCLNEGTYSGIPKNKGFVDKNVVEQIDKQREASKHGGAHHESNDHEQKAAGHDEGTKKEEHTEDGGHH